MLFLINLKGYSKNMVVKPLKKLLQIYGKKLNEKIDYFVRFLYDLYSCYI